MLNAKKNENLRETGNTIDLIIRENDPILERKPSYLEHDIRKKLYKKKEICQIKAKEYNKSERKIRLVYFVFSGLAVILSVVISSLTGGNSMSNLNKNDVIIFVLSLIVSISSVISSFFQLEQKISNYHQTSVSLNEVVLDIETELSKKKVSNSEYENYFNLVNERYKMIQSNALDLKQSICCCE